MTPKIKTNWHLYTPDLEISFPSMKSWVEENNSLMNRLRLLETKIDLIVLDEQICKHHDAQTSAGCYQGICKIWSLRRRASW